MLSSASQAIEKLDRGELDMQTLRTSDCAAFDCSEEFSLYRLLHVRKLVEEADTPTEDEELASCTKIEWFTKKTVSKVETPTADQYLTGNVV